ncbi:zinc ribbon domain-containing protein [Eubacteriales bacterium OttesenSCG-928-K08]|nr:zinc ribbon domain-containing protein [Eubacteriales bacterium OttesenSCG-928-K08]
MSLNTVFFSVVFGLLLVAAAAVIVLLMRSEGNGKRKKCPACGDPISQTYSFCPHCGYERRAH